MALAAETKILTVPDQALLIPAEHKDRYIRLEEGIHSSTDPITWRTLGTGMRILSGVPEELADWQPASPKSYTAAKALTIALTAQSHLAPLLPEILYSVGGRQFENQFDIELPPLDYLVINSRHLGDSLFIPLANDLSQRGYRVAAFNAVGRYNDMQSRIAGPSRLTRPVEQVIFIASTQVQYGGRVDVLANAMRLLRNPWFSCWANRVVGLIPVVGGARGHRLGQDDALAYEALETKADPKLLTLPLKDVLEQLHKELAALPVYLQKLQQEGYVLSQIETEVVARVNQKLARGEPLVPSVTFYTVDIHNQQEPADTFRESGFNFISDNPAPELADAIYQQLETENLLDYPLVIVASDAGSVPRTNLLAESLLRHSKNRLREIVVIYLGKERKVAGKVNKVWVDKVETWLLQDNDIIIKPMEILSPKQPYTRECVVIHNDDMIDTAYTAGDDVNLLKPYFPKAKRRFFSATHPVLSKGPERLKLIDADTIFLGNTLVSPGLNQDPRVKDVNIAPTITRGLVFSH